MKICILSREELMKLFKAPSENNVALISIRSPGEKTAELLYTPSKQMELVFDDTYPAEVSLLQYTPMLYSGDMARGIVDFVNQNCQTADILICQCTCGKSRSSAVAAAIREYFYGDGDEILKSDLYRPNMFVYNLTLEAFRSQTKNMENN